MKFTHAFFAFGLSAVCALAQTPPSTPQKIPLLGQQPQQPAASNEPLDKQKVGYALGLLQGDSIKKGDLGVDYQSLIDGMSDALMSNKPPKMTEQEAHEWYNKWNSQRRNQMMER